MKTISKFGISIVLCALTGLSLFTGCGSNNNPASPAATATPVPPTATSCTSCTATNSPTNSPTATVTPTPTISPTLTITNTATPTPTATTSNTATDSPTNTQTNTLTNTTTHSPTATTTNSPTSSPTVTSTNTTPASPTSTYTFIPNPTLTATWGLPVIYKPQQIAWASTAGGSIYVPSIQYSYILQYSGGVSTQIGSVGVADGQFTTPYGVATDSSGNLYVADTGNNRIQKFNSSGVWQWSSPSSGVTAGTGAGQFNGPMAVAVDGSGNVWATDSGNNRIVELNPTGGAVTTISGTFGTGSITSPQGIAIDTTNNWVYVSNLFCCIFRFKTDGTFLNNLGTYGTTGNGVFETPFALAVNAAGTRLYVVDPNLMKAQILDPTGAFLGSYGSYGMFGNGSPTGVAVDSSGNAYYAVIGTQSIQVFGP